MEDWDDYKFILAVGRHGGLSAAARALNVNHSTVSRRISAAEKRLGARLFDRLQSGFIATEAGRQAIDVAARLEQELFDLNRSIAAKDNILAGPLHVTTPQLIFQYSVCEMMAKFARLYPQIDLTLSAALENLNLNQRESDVAIRVGNNPDPNLYGRRVTKQNRGYYASKSYLEEKGIAQDDDVGLNFAPIRCIHFVWWENKVNDDIKRHYPNAKVGIKFDDMVALQSAVKQGMGIGRLPCLLGDSDPDLHRVPGIPLISSQDIWVLTHQDLKQVERVRVFMQFIAEEFKSREALFMGSGHKKIR